MLREWGGVVCLEGGGVCIEGGGVCLEGGGVCLEDGVVCFGPNTYMQSEEAFLRVLHDQAYKCPLIHHLVSMFLFLVLCNYRWQHTFNCKVPRSPSPNVYLVCRPHPLM